MKKKDASKDPGTRAALKLTRVTLRILDQKQLQCAKGGWEPSACCPPELTVPDAT